MDKTPAEAGVSVHGSEQNPSTTTRKIRNVLSLDDARRRRELSRRRDSRPDEDGPVPPRAA